MVEGPAIPGESPTLVLKDVPLVAVDWPAVGEVLERAGIPRDEAERYVEEFATKVHRSELAKLLAERISYT